MKKSLFKNSTTCFSITMCLTVLLVISCSPDELPQQDSSVVFTSFNVSQTEAFIDQKITIVIEGNNYTDVAITSDNPSVTINKINTTVFEIASNKATRAYIYVTLSNKTDKAGKGINIGFNEHGVKDFNTVEGIKVNTDKSLKVLSLLGEPDFKANSTAIGSNSEIWSYASKGLAIYVDKNSQIINQIDMYSSNYYFVNKNKVNINFTDYPYLIGSDWKINNSTTTMDMVISELGIPPKKSSSTTITTNRTYQYTSKQIAFSFYSDSVDNYYGKKIIFFAIY